MDVSPLQNRVHIRIKAAIVIFCRTDSIFLRTAVVNLRFAAEKSY